MTQSVIAQIESKFPNNISLLILYNEEKESASFPSDNDIFPSFKIWKQQYKQEWLASHVDSKLVNAEEAVTETEKELINMIAEQEKETDQKKIKKVVDKKPKESTPIVQKVKTASKSELAEQIYKEMMIDGVHPIRKEVIKRFIDEVGLTQAGASTYQYNIKKKLSQ